MVCTAAPTVINNAAETIASVSRTYYADGRRRRTPGLAKERNGGDTLCLGISGHVVNPGVYELPMGYNLKKAIYAKSAVAFAAGRKLKAVVPGGSSTSPVMLPEEIDVGMDFDQLVARREACWGRLVSW